MSAASVMIPPKRLRGEVLRGAVLESALRLFSEHGYFATSIHDIRREAGVSIGAIYHHFGNKEQLAKALYDDLLERMAQAIESAIDGLEGCRERARAIIGLLFEMTRDDPMTMRFVLLAKHREFLSDEPPICSSRPFAMMRAVLEDGIASGEVREIDSWVAASAMFGGALRMMNLSLDGVLKAGLEQYLDQVVDCGWRAVRS
jgi:AcrR family transcriptional regulator